MGQPISATLVTFRGRIIAFGEDTKHSTPFLAQTDLWHVFVGGQWTLPYTIDTRAPPISFSGRSRQAIATSNVFEVQNPDLVGDYCSGKQSIWWPL